MSLNFKYLFESKLYQVNSNPDDLMTTPITELPKFGVKNNQLDSTDFSNLMSQVQIQYHNGYVDLESNRLATTSYLTTEVYPNLIWFSSLVEKINWMVYNNYWSRDVFDNLTYDDVLVLFNKAYSLQFEYKSYLGALFFFRTYSAKGNVKGLYTERFEDRSVLTAITCSSSIDHALRLIEYNILGCYQPATPTFGNAGKANGGELVSCYLLSLTDTMNNITTRITEIMQLSKRGGGIAIDLSNLREHGAPIRNIPGCGNGLIGLAKIIDGACRYSNQADTRRGSGVVYVNIFHPDALSIIDAKREAIDEGLRLKNLSVGILLPDIFYTLCKENKDIYCFSVYDIYQAYGLRMSEFSMTDYYYTFLDDPKIKKRNLGSARVLGSHISFVQSQSGYPFIINIDTVNRANNIHGRISMSNLCTEIFQVSTLSDNSVVNDYTTLGKDIACNLGSLNVATCMSNGYRFKSIVETAIRSLSVVSKSSDISCAPSIAAGNNAYRAVGLGLMNLHGAFMKYGMQYGDSDSLEFARLFTQTMRLYALDASCKLAEETGDRFFEFEKSKYATGEAFIPYIDGTHLLTTTSKKLNKIFKECGFELPTLDYVIQLKNRVMLYGLYNAYQLAIAPTGTISYTNYSTSSGTPVTAVIEEREEGERLGRAQYLAPYLTNENKHLYKNAFEIGSKAIIDVYSVMTPHIDQGCSLTIHTNRDREDGSPITTRDLFKMILYAYKKNIKSLYYTRSHRSRNNNNTAIAFDFCDMLGSQITEDWGGVDMDMRFDEECVNCAI